MGPLTTRTYKYDLESEEKILRFAKSKYVSNGSLAILAYVEIEDNVWEIYDTLTVNLGDAITDNVQYINNNHWPEGIERWLTANDIGMMTGNMELSGFVYYSEFMFFDEFLDSMSGEEIDGIWNEPAQDTSVVPDSILEEMDTIDSILSGNAYTSQSPEHKRAFLGMLQDWSSPDYNFPKSESYDIPY